MASIPKSKVIIRSVADTAVEDRVRECMEYCDWKSLVPPDARVVVKPNLCTSLRDKWEMSNTDPRITEAVCGTLRERTRNVVLCESDGLRQSAWEAFEISGYVEMAKRAGVDLVNLTESPWREVDVPPAGRVGLPATVLDADVFITLPALKTHALTYFTGAIKNQWGCVPHHDRILFHRYLDPMLASLHSIFKPSFAIMDGIVCMEGRGPTNGKSRRMDLILGSRDSVALDATAARLVGLDPMKARHLVLTAKSGAGAIDESAIEVDGDRDRHSVVFEPAILDKAIAAMDYMSRYRWFVKYMLEKDAVFYPIRAGVQWLRKIGVVEGN